MKERERSLQNVKLAQIGVNQFGQLENALHDFHAVQVQCARQRLVKYGVFKARRRKSVLANETHH